MGDRLGDGLKSGKHPNKALSAAFVRSVKEPGKYFDGEGLYLKVDLSGAKRWVQRIVIRGKRTEMGLGSASLIGLADARETALENRKLARQGDDPLRTKREALAVLSFEEAAREVHRLHLPSWTNKKHAAQFISTLQTYAFPRTGRKKVTEIDTADVLAVLQPIWLEKSETASRVRQRIGLIMKWAIAKGWRQDNPAENIDQALPKQNTSPKHRKSLPYSQIPDFLEAVHNSDAQASTKFAFEFLILTAGRPVEVREAVWSEINLETKEWKIPAVRMKAKREHRVPLSTRATEILVAAQTISDGSDLVFPGNRFGKPLSDMTLLKLARELGFDVDVHGFRTSFKTWAQERTNTPREVSESALSHKIQNKAEAAYARSDFFDKRRRLMEKWSAHASLQPSNIISLALDS